MTLYKQKRAPCPRCGENGVIRYDTTIKKLWFSCFLFGCAFSCLAKDLRFNYQHYKEKREAEEVQLVKTLSESL